jgi:hypothetical protein
MLRRLVTAETRHLWRPAFRHSSPPFGRCQPPPFYVQKSKGGNLAESLVRCEFFYAFGRTSAPKSPPARRRGSDACSCLGSPIVRPRPLRPLPTALAATRAIKGRRPPKRDREKRGGSRQPSGQEHAALWLLHRRLMQVRQLGLDQETYSASSPTSTARSPPQSGTQRRRRPVRQLLLSGRCPRHQHHRHRHHSHVDGPLDGSTVILGQSSTSTFNGYAFVAGGMPGNPTIYALAQTPQIHGRLTPRGTSGPDDDRAAEPNDVAQLS